MPSKMMRAIKILIARDLSQTLVKGEPGAKRMALKILPLKMGLMLIFLGEKGGGTEKFCNPKRGGG